LVAAEPLENDTFSLEGHEIRIIEQGRTDGPNTTSLHVPSIDLVVAGDVVYNQCHMYVRRHHLREPEQLGRGAGPAGGAEAGDCCCRSQEAWCARLAIGDQGHEALSAGRDRLQQIATSGEELFNQMAELYPHWVANQSWLMFGFPTG
jgi:hypothetical protein